MSVCLIQTMLDVGIGVMSFAFQLQTVIHGNLIRLSFCHEPETTLQLRDLHLIFFFSYRLLAECLVETVSSTVT